MEASKNDVIKSILDEAFPLMERIEEKKFETVFSLEKILKVACMGEEIRHWIVVSKFSEASKYNIEKPEKITFNAIDAIIVTDNYIGNAYITHPENSIPYMASSFKRKSIRSMKLSVCQESQCHAFSLYFKEGDNFTIRFSSREDFDKVVEFVKLLPIQECILNPYLPKGYGLNQTSNGGLTQC